MRDVTKILGPEADKVRAHDTCSFSWDGSYSIITCDVLQGSGRARHVSDREELLYMHNYDRIVSYACKYVI